MSIQQSCYLCEGKEFKKRNGKVRDNPHLDVMECVSCGLVFLSSPSHIYEGFYESSKMHEGEIDINTWLRETAWDDERRFNVHRRLIENRSILDYGCGNGGFLLRCKGIASHAVGVEPEVRLAPHFKKEGIQVFRNIDEVQGYFDVITCFHVLEHLLDPVTILKRLAERLSKEGVLIVETPNANDALLTLFMNEAFSTFTYWSCHIFLFTNSTLSSLAQKAELKINYIKQIQRYPLSNHLHWLAKGKPNGHKEWSFLNSPELFSAYEKQLASIGACDTIVASISKY